MCVCVCVCVTAWGDPGGGFGSLPLSDMTRLIKDVSDVL